LYGTNALKWGFYFPSLFFENPLFTPWPEPLPKIKTFKRFFRLFNPTAGQGCIKSLLLVFDCSFMCEPKRNFFQRVAWPTANWIDSYGKKK
jgi:hypothetical protein